MVLTDEQWAVLEPLVEQVKPKGKTPLRHLSDESRLGIEVHGVLRTDADARCFVFTLLAGHRNVHSIRSRNCKYYNGCRIG